ncbi:MAG TPA: hypothetical protein VD902_21815 [Symbiobacteriaceae bacterium]|nr:hypothetical protein [Symbiobacteriaceae bacterium]
MDPRKWLLSSGPPKADELNELVKHVPCSTYRSPKTLQLFVAGMYTGFMLTDGHGRPTLALETMANLMGAELCTAGDMPQRERKAFKLDDGTLANVLTEQDRWYLRGLSDRVKKAWSMSAWQNQWVHYFLPGLDGARMTAKEEDGKRHQRTHYIAFCKPNWELTDDVYEGLWRWTYDHWGPAERQTGWHPARWDDAYTLFQDDGALRSSLIQAGPGGRPAALRTPEAVVLPAPGGADEAGAKEGTVAAGPDRGTEGDRWPAVESALLLRDLWEVLNLTENRIANKPGKWLREFAYVSAELMKRPFGGEEVLF